MILESIVVLLVNLTVQYKPLERGVMFQYFTQVGDCSTFVLAFFCFDVFGNLLKLSHATTLVVLPKKLTSKFQQGDA